MSTFGLIWVQVSCRHKRWRLYIQILIRQGTTIFVERQICLYLLTNSPNWPHIYSATRTNHLPCRNKLKISYKRRATLPTKNLTIRLKKRVYKKLSGKMHLPVHMNVYGLCPSNLNLCLQYFNHMKSEFIHTCFGLARLLRCFGRLGEAIALNVASRCKLH